MSASYHDTDLTDFWEYFGHVWGCVPLTDEPTTEHDQRPARSGVVIIIGNPIAPRPAPQRHDIFDNRHVGSNGDFDPDDTQRIVIAWEGEDNDNDIQ